MNTAVKQDLNGFILAELGANVLKKLDNQERGGNNNNKGNNHEQYFATYKLAKYFAIAQANDDIEIETQARAFVDDLIIYNKADDAKRSYQLKDSKAVYWSGKKGISTYFIRQHKIDCKYYKHAKSETVLVLSNIDTYNRRSCDIPNSIASYTRCLYFTNSSSPNELLLENVDFRKSIGDLCSFPSDIDKLTVVLQYLIGAWVTHNKTEKSVKKLVELAAGVAKPDFFKLDSVNLKLDVKLTQILDNIDDLRYLISNSYLMYYYKNFEGQVRFKIGSEDFQKICNNVIRENPMSAQELFSILMSSGDNT
jgi:hypothetical protein